MSAFRSFSRRFLPGIAGGLVMLLAGAALEAQCPPPLAVPGLPNSTGTALSGVTVSWTLSDPKALSPESFSIYVAEGKVSTLDPKQPAENTSPISGSARTFKLGRTLKPATTYTWFVVSKNSKCLAGSQTTVSSPENFATVTCAPPSNQSPANGATGVSTSVTFSWSPIPYATLYELYTSLDGGKTFNYTTKTAGTSVNWAFSPDTTVYWKVRGISSDGCPSDTRYSTATSFKTLSCALGVPSQLLPANGATSPVNVAFSWKAITSAASYGLLTSINGASFVEKNVGNVTQASLTMPAGAKVEWYVTAYASNGCPKTDSTSRWIVNIEQACPTGAPQLIYPKEGSEATSPVKFQWSAVNGAEFYELFVAERGSSTFVSAGKTTGTGIERSVSGSVQWYVDAYFPGNCKPTRSTTGKFTIPVVTCPKSGPVLVSPSSGASAAAPVTFSWQAVAGAIKYVVLVRDTSSALNPFDDVAATSGTSASVDLAAGGWEWKVVAYPDRCDAVVSETRTLKVTAPVCNITPPSPVYPKNGATLASSIVSFEWNGISSAIEYTVEASLNGAAAVAIGTTSATSLVAKVPEGTVSWRVVAMVPRCQPVASPASSFTVKLASCPTAIPSLLSPAAGATVTSPVKLAWSAVAGATGYRAWISVDGASPVNFGGTVTTTSVDADLPAGTIVWYVEAVASNCPSTFSSKSKFVVGRSATCGTERPVTVAPPNGATAVASPVTFQWKEVAGASGYNLFASVDGEPPANLGYTTSTSLERAIGGSKVTWWVVASIRGCDPTVSDKSSFAMAPGDGCAIVAPSRLLPVDNASVKSPLKFAWTSAGADVVYRLWVMRDGERPVVLGETVDTAIERLLDPGSYSWFVEAFRKGCPGVKSDSGRFAILAQAGCPTEAPLLLAPPDGTANLEPETRFAWASVTGAVAYELWIALEGGVPGLVAVTRDTEATVRLRPGKGKWFVKALFEGCAPTRSQDFTFSVAVPATCDQKPPYLLSPPIRESLPLVNPIGFEWTPVRGATLYHLFASVDEGEPVKLGETTQTSMKLEVPVGRIRWFVVAEVAGCPKLASTAGVFFVKASGDCDVPRPPELRAVLEAKSGDSYRVAWTAVENAGSYEIQESKTADFASAETTASNSFSALFSHVVTSPERFYYRVRAIGSCTEQPGDYSHVVAVTVTPKQVSNAPAVDNVAPLEQNGTITIPFFIGGPAAKSAAATTFSASSSQSWMTVTPSSGTIPPEGITLTISADASVLGPGANTGTLRIDSTSALLARDTEAGGSSSTPVSISIVSPVTPTTKSSPTADSLIIPAVGHAAGNNSQWQSDVRISNLASQSMNYLLFFTPSGTAGTGTVKQASITVGAGQTVALNDVVKSWFGIGASGESATGIMEVRPQSNAISTSSGSSLANASSLGSASIATSRTYNLSSAGTFGQFIPAVSYSKFVSKGATLSLQQVAQSAQYRTNVGVVEASGEPATVQFTVFSSAGQELGKWTESLQGGEHRQFDRMLAQHGITLEGGRIEVDVVSDAGRITAYASTVDNQTGDPIFVPPVELGSVPKASKFVVPGVGDVDNGLASWRTDVRLFNAGDSATSATLTYYPQGSSTPAGSKQVSIGAGSVLEVNDLLKSTFGISNSAGALHVTTPDDAALVPTARTYNKTANGTYGQFIPAVTEAYGTSLGGRALQLPQVEQSAKFRTNLGLTELSGKGATVEVMAIVPGALAAPFKTYTLGPNEFRQIGFILNDLGVSEAYNARITVSVTAGDGTVSAYASVIDASTQDPTYVPSQ